jgi:lysophospholipase L1-like esterase
LSNRFGTEPVRIGRAAIGTRGNFTQVTIGGHPSVRIPAGETRWTDPIELQIDHRGEITIDLYLPEPTPYVTAGGFQFARSVPGDFAGQHPFPLEGTAPGEVDASREFPAANTGTTPEPDGTGWSLPEGGPFLRTVEVAGEAARAVIVAIGGSSTAMGWPQFAAAALPADAGIAVINRGISGNRIRLDAPEGTPSWGLAGLTRFDQDVLATDGVTHTVIAYNSNDWGLPGRVTSLDEMPTVADVTGAYQELIDRAQAAGIKAILATVTPLAPEMAEDPQREGFRLAVNEWIRTSGREFVDFDAAIRSATDPSRLEDVYAAPDDTHPNVNGERRLAQVMVETLARMGLWGRSG